MRPKPKTGSETGKQTHMTSPKSGATIPTGAHPANTGGKKGRSGRKPEKWRQWAAEAVNSPACRKACEEILQNPEHPGFHKVLAILGPHGHGTPNQPFEDGTDTPRPIQVEFLEEEK